MSGGTGDIVVIAPGLQSTIQAAPRTGHRHLGVPKSGAADPLSMALANRLVGNTSGEAAIEATLTGITLRLNSELFVAVTGADAHCSVNGKSVEMHRSLRLKPGDELAVGAAEHGVRTYVAIAGGLEADEFLGSASTYLPAKLGGHGGVSLSKGDVLRAKDPGIDCPELATPDEFRVAMIGSNSVRAVLSAESREYDDIEQLFEQKFSISTRSDRMGVKLEGFRFAGAIDARMASVPVFPGTIQCPPDGAPYVLSVDSGTTGGYPRIAKIVRMDLHLLGQLRPGSQLAFIERSEGLAAAELRDKHAFWAEWLPDIAAYI